MMPIYIFILIILFYLQNIIICDKSETMYSGVYHIYIYRRNLSESKSAKNKGLRNKSEKNKLKNGVDEKNDSTPLS